MHSPSASVVLGRATGGGDSEYDGRDHGHSHGHGHDEYEYEPDHNVQQIDPACRDLVIPEAGHRKTLLLPDEVQPKKPHHPAPSVPSDTPSTRGLSLVSPSLVLYLTSSFPISLRGAVMPDRTLLVRHGEDDFLFPDEPVAPALAAAVPGSVAKPVSSGPLSAVKPGEWTFSLSILRIK